MRLRPFGLALRARRVSLAAVAPPLLCEGGNIYWNNCGIRYTISFPRSTVINSFAVGFRSIE